MRIADLPNPAPDTVTWITSIEPWQREGLLRVRELLGIDADALLRAGVTLVLSIVGTLVPETTTPPAFARGATEPSSPQEQVDPSVVAGRPTSEPPGDGPT
jgi:hypothetical protein